MKSAGILPGPRLETSGGSPVDVIDPERCEDRITAHGPVLRLENIIFMAENLDGLRYDLKPHFPG